MRSLHIEPKDGFILGDSMSTSQKMIEIWMLSNDYTISVPFIELELVRRDKIINSLHIKPKHGVILDETRALSQHTVDKN